MKNCIFKVGHLYVFDEAVICMCTEVREGGKSGNFCNIMNFVGEMLTPEERATLFPEHWRKVTDKENRLYYDNLVKSYGLVNEHYDGEDVMKAGTVCRVVVDGDSEDYMCLVCTDVESRGKVSKPMNTTMAYSITQKTGFDRCPWAGKNAHINMYRPTEEQLIEYWAYWNRVSEKTENSNH